MSNLVFAKTTVKTFSLVTATYPPYNYFDKTVKGLNVDIIKAAMLSQGYQVKVQILPFARALEHAKKGKADGITLWYAKDREQWFDFSEPFTQSSLVFYKKKSLAFEFKEVADLAPYSIGIVQKYAYPSNFCDQKNLKTSEVLTDEQNINKLVYGRIDLALIDKQIAKYIISKEHPDKKHLFDSAGTLKSENFYLGVSKHAEDSQAKLAAFNLGLRFIAKSGELEKIISQYQ